MFRSSRLCTLLAIATAVTLAVTGCGLSTSPLARAAEEVRGSALVVYVAYHPPGLIGREFLEVVLESEATDGQARDLWCNHLVPFGGNDENTVVDIYTEAKVRSVPMPACEVAGATG